MAESDPKPQEGQGGSWWDSWIQAAKETSASAYEFVKKDLGEFTCTVQSDTEHAITATSNTVKETIKAENASTAKNRMKEGISTLFQGITKALTIPPDDEGEKPILVVSSESAIYDRSKARLHAIQVDPGTYLDEPSGSPQHFKEWCRHFDIESKKGDISELLVSKVEVRALYTKLVPAEIAHATFWQRYFYKLHQMALDEARKQALIKRAESSGRNNSVNDDWGSGDEDDIEIVELEDVASKSTNNTPAAFPTASPAESSKSETNSVQKTEMKTDSPKPETKSVQKTEIKTEIPKRETNSVQKTEMKTDSPKPVTYSVQKTEMKTDSPKPETNSVQKTEMKTDSPKPETKSVQKTEVNTECKGEADTSKSLIEKKPAADDYKIDDAPTCTSKVLPEKLETQPECPQNVLNENMKKADLQKVENINANKSETENSNKNTNNSTNFDQSPVGKLSETVGLLQTSNIVDKKDELERSKTFESSASEKDIGTKSENTEIKSVEPENFGVDPSDQSTKPVKELDQSQFSVSKIDESESKDSKTKGEVLPPSGSDKNEEKVTSDIKTNDTGDMVIVESDRISPISDSSGNKDTSTEEDWDKDFDLDVTEEELRAAEELAKTMGDNLDLDEDDDWENWE